MKDIIYCKKTPITSMLKSRSVPWFVTSTTSKIMVSEADGSIFSDRIRPFLCFISHYRKYNNLTTDHAMNACSKCKFWFSRNKLAFYLWKCWDNDQCDCVCYFFPRLIFVSDNFRILRTGYIFTLWSVIYLRPAICLHVPPSTFIPSCSDVYWVYYRKREIILQCRVDAGPASQTLNNIDPTLAVRLLVSILSQINRGSLRE